MKRFKETATSNIRHNGGRKRSTPKLFNAVVLLNLREKCPETWTYPTSWIATINKDDLKLKYYIKRKVHGLTVKN